MNALRNNQKQISINVCILNNTKVAFLFCFLLLLFLVLFFLFCFFATAAVIFMLFYCHLYLYCKIIRKWSSHTMFLHIKFCTIFDFSPRLQVWYTAKNIVISPNFPVWKFSGKVQLRHMQKCAFPQHFHTRKLGEITVLFVMKASDKINQPILIISEAVFQSSSAKELIWKASLSSQGRDLHRSPFYNKFAGIRAAV